MTVLSPRPRHAGRNLIWAEVKESFVMGIGALTTHKLRSSLTVLGVLVGVFSIIVVMTAMRVLQSNIEKELSQLGSHTFQIRKWPAVHFGGPEGFEKYLRRKDITFAHGKAVMEKATLAQSVGIQCGFWTGEAISRYDKTPPNVSLVGATVGGFPARNWIVGEGRGLIESDIDSAKDVCVLGGGLAKILFPHGSALGEKAKFDGIGYTVVGVLEPKGASLGGDQDNFAVIPLTTGLNRYGRVWRSLSILVQAQNQAMYEDTVEQVRGILRTARKVKPGVEDDFEVFSNDSLISQFKSFTLTVRIGVAVVSSIALVAAGIGIMNIMLVSVTERTREIGIRRAIGAKKRNIMTQFIMEAIVLCQVGGVIGVLLGILGGNSAAYFLKLPPVIPLDWVVIGLTICSVVGVLFGSYPAYKAANLDPIESLRYE
ncbi:MAG: ABC transporter permease [Verrucomicrobia bacterium]|jgi:putative ABC transport system permease protein|nr:ABC transporter permease [Verrucomicrobiota bacterium]OQC67234.1 MAG: Macrolide export ATP-binding/permease protein MacB [Verrucomicrobia bacterium ADurb.Bin006]MDI9381479.1 ABC transporter permease [Verrucomicrobiota bacterium]NMD19754.1 FtsX-like permease family protein [Verrucomicrobiota bacterium]HNV00554.1 ABC transporter permease [Verrucomicrobiota bacterium]